MDVKDKQRAVIGIPVARRVCGRQNYEAPGECLWWECILPGYGLSMDEGSSVRQWGASKWRTPEGTMSLRNRCGYSIDSARWSECFAPNNRRGVVDLAGNGSHSSVRNWMHSEGSTVDFRCADRWSWDRFVWRCVCSCFQSCERRRATIDAILSPGTRAGSPTNMFVTGHGQQVMTIRLNWRIGPSRPPTLCWPLKSAEKGTYISDIAPRVETGEITICTRLRSDGLLERHLSHRTETLLLREPVAKVGGSPGRATRQLHPGLGPAAMRRRTPKGSRADVDPVFAMNAPDEPGTCNGFHRMILLQRRADDTIELSIFEKRRATGLTIREAVLLEMGPMGSDCPRADREKCCAFLVGDRPRESARVAKWDT
jgi:hypothetical protein